MKSAFYACAMKHVAYYEYHVSYNLYIPYIAPYQRHTKVSYLADRILY